MAVDPIEDDNDDEENQLPMGDDFIDIVKTSNEQIWSPYEEDALISTLVSIVNEGMKVDNAFKAGYLARLKTKLADILPGTDLRGSPHIE
ncbi:hypothetical protein ACSBR2_018051 [Camellia fascicularis]